LTTEQVANMTSSQVRALENADLQAMSTDQLWR
jgi:hypothetical protein